MTDRHDDLLFAPDPPLFAEGAAEVGNLGDPGRNEAPAPEEPRAWKVLVADDDREVHSLTSLVLSDFSFEGRGLDFLHAHSGQETVEVLRENSDTALVLLDVVMETDDAGLQAVRRIREELGNSFVRIILRTGQPGQAPEQEVVTNYDINDYKAKTELTAQKLSTTVTAALRTYRDIRAIERNRVGLERVNDVSGDLLSCQTPEDLAGLALRAAADLVGEEAADAVTGYFASGVGEATALLAGVGEYAAAAGLPLGAVVDAALLAQVDAALSLRDPNAADWGYAASFSSRTGLHGELVLVTGRPLEFAQMRILDVLISNVAAAYDNIHLNREILETQTEMILTLGEVVESRSRETANHVKRVGSYARQLALLAGMPDSEADLIQQAAPLHDVGKIGVPDAVLMKPGRYDESEREIMKEHARIGWEILSKSRRELFRVAAVIAHEHHEKWDGSGYPRGLAGEEIHIYGRIVALADVFDALAHARVYKPAMPLEDCLRIIGEGRGTHFDPELTDLFLANVEVFEGIRVEMEDVVPDAAGEVVEIS